MKRDHIKSYWRRVFPLIGMLMLLSGCDNLFSLEENPTDEVSEGIFWETENDAHLALMGCYRGEPRTGWWEASNGWDKVLIHFSQWTDIAINKESGSGYPQGNDINPTHYQVTGLWSYNYMVIGRANYFLDNIDKVNMDENKKAEMNAEVRFLRAYSYFWLSQLYGNVPLVETTLTFEEANNVSQSSQEAVVNFAINELAEAAPNLPEVRPPAEKGRIEKGAALALMGRFLMAEERWEEAAAVYKSIIDLNRYQIDPRFKKLFEDEGENSNEIIFARKYMENEFGEPMSQQAIKSSWYGGYSSQNFTQTFVDKFPMVDGKTIEESDLYDSAHPFENRDPRLYATVLLPGYSSVRGKIFQGHPDSIALTGQSGPGITGYHITKFVDWDYGGDTWNYGGDYPLIRYAEVLLSYLECRLKTGGNIDQNLLDETINKVRGREEIQMPPVTETDPDKLMEIIRTERCIELACEGGIRYWDLVRWKLAREVISRKYYGVKITDNPGEYNGKYIINDEGHLYVREKIFYEHNYLWPIPQSELDVNSNLKQNTGYN